MVASSLSTSWFFCCELVVESQRVVVVVVAVDPATVEEEQGTRTNALTDAHRTSPWKARAAVTSRKFALDATVMLVAANRMDEMTTSVKWIVLRRCQPRTSSVSRKAKDPCFSRL